MAAIKSNGESLPSPLLKARLFNIVWPESLQPWLEQVLVFMTLFALLATGLRVQSRRLNHQPLWWDDWLAIGNMAWFAVIVALIAVDVGLGLGLHFKYVAKANNVAMVQLALTVDLLYIWSLVWSKLSLLALYYRVFRFGYFKYACCSVAALTVAWAIISTILLFVSCVPLSRYWDLAVKGYCMRREPIRLFNSIATIVTDVMILCLPIPQVWGLQGLPVSDKIGLTALFGLGFFVVSIAGVRIEVQGHDESDDETFTIAPDAGWTVIEMAAAIVSASFPAMGPAVIELGRYVRAGAIACWGGVVHRRATHPRQGMELRTRNEEADSTGLGSSQQHPDDVDGSFRRLYSKGHNGSALTHVSEDGQPVPAREPTDSEDESSGLRVAVQSDGASEEVLLNAIRVQTCITQSVTK